jgi:hypothetical protein
MTSSSLHYTSFFLTSQLSPEPGKCSDLGSIGRSDRRALAAPQAAAFISRNLRYIVVLPMDNLAYGWELCGSSEKIFQTVSEN